MSQSARLSVGVQLLFGQCPNERGIIYNGASFSQIDRVTKKITQNENRARVAEKQPFLSFAKKWKTDQKSVFRYKKNLKMANGW